MYKISKLLDQFIEGMKKLPHILQLVQAYPDLFTKLFTFTGDVTARDVLDALFVHEGTQLRLSDEMLVDFCGNTYKDAIKKVLIQCIYFIFY